MIRVTYHNFGVDTTTGQSLVNMVNTRAEKILPFATPVETLVSGTKNGPQALEIECETSACNDRHMISAATLALYMARIHDMNVQLTWNNTSFTRGNNISGRAQENAKMTVPVTADTARLALTSTATAKKAVKEICGTFVALPMASLGEKYAI